MSESPPEPPAPDIRPIVYSVKVGRYGAEVTWDAPAGAWQIQSPAVSLVQAALGSMGLLGALPDPATFRYSSPEEAEAAAVTVLRAAEAYMTAVLGTAPRPPAG